MALLAHRVPITLLADLLDPDGPASREIYRVEAVAGRRTPRTRRTRMCGSRRNSTRGG